MIPENKEHFTKNKNPIKKLNPFQVELKGYKLDLPNKIVELKDVEGKDIPDELKNDVRELYCIDNDEPKAYKSNNIDENEKTSVSSIPENKEHFTKNKNPIKKLNPFQVELKGYKLDLPKKCVQVKDCEGKIVPDKLLEDYLRLSNFEQVEEKGVDVFNTPDKKKDTKIFRLGDINDKKYTENKNPVNVNLDTLFLGEGEDTVKIKLPEDHKQTLFDSKGIPVPDHLVKDWKSLNDDQLISKEGFTVYEPEDDDKKDPIIFKDLSKFGKGKKFKTENGYPITRKTKYRMRLGRATIFDIPNKYLELKDVEGNDIPKELIVPFKQVTDDDTVQDQGLLLFKDSDRKEKPTRIFTFGDLEVGKPFYLKDGTKIEKKSNSEIMLGDRRILIPLELQGGQCDNCQSSFNKWRKKQVCTECKDAFCSACIDDYQFKSLEWKERKYVCDHCLIKLKPKIEEKGRKVPERLLDSQRENNSILLGLAGNLDPLPHQNFSIKQSHAIQNEKINCKCCEKKFSFWKRPRKCAKCDELVCTKCTTPNLQSIPRLLGFARMEAVCKSCWPETKKELHKELQENPELVDQIESEISSCDYQLKMNQKEEEEGEGKKDDKGKEELKENFKNKRCGVCILPLTYMDGARHCSHCNKVVCSNCSGKFVISEKDSEKLSVLCTNCLPQFADTKIEKPPRGVIENNEIVPLEEKQLKLIVENKCCDLCEKKFNFLRRPHPCADCDNVVCHYCSERHNSKLFNFKNKRLCVKCLSSHRKLVEKKLQLSSEQDEAKLELQTIDVALNSERKANAERPAEPLLGVSKATCCPNCNRKYTFFRKATTCPQCSKQKCTGCTTRIKSSVLGWFTGKHVCDPCLPAVSERIKTTPVPKGIKKEVHQSQIQTELNDIELAKKGNLCIDTPGLDQYKFNSKEQKSIEKGKVKCKCCKHKFGFFRGPRKCGNCSELVCSKCSKHLEAVPLLLVHSANSCVCKSCWPQIKSKLEEKGKQDKSVSDVVSTQIKLAEKDLDNDSQVKHELEDLKVKESSYSKKKCDCCTKKFTIFNGITKCEKCENIKCKRCCGKFIVPSLNPLSSSVVCKSCVAELETQNPRIEADDGDKTNIFVASRSSSAQLTEKQKEKLKQKANCKICEKKFGFFRHPHECKRCESDVCRSCSCGNFVSLVLGIKKSRVCKNCLKEIKVEINEKVKKNPKLASQARKELNAVDSAIDGTLNERQFDLISATSLPEHALLLKDDDDNKLKKEKVIKIEDDKGKGEQIEEVELKVKPISVKVGKDDQKKQKKCCSLCESNYSFFRREKICSECDKNVCRSCSVEYQFKSLEWPEKRCICDECLPSIKSQIEKKAAKKKGSDDAKIELEAIEMKEKGALNSFEPEVTFTKAEEKGIKKNNRICTSCSKNFGFFRQPKKCNKCNNLVCSKCVHKFSFIKNLLGWNKDSIICKTCWPDVKDALKKKAEEDPSLKEAIAREIELGDEKLKKKDDNNNDDDDDGEQDPLELEFPENKLKKCKCPACKKKLSVIYGVTKCEKCNKPSCKKSSCTSKFIVPSINAFKPVTVCKSCLPKIESKIEKPNKRSDYFYSPSSPRSAKLNTNEEKKIKEGANCHICEKKFNFFRVPKICKTCDKDVCISCSKGNFPSLFKDLRTCDDCDKKLKLSSPSFVSGSEGDCNHCSGHMKWIKWDTISDVNSAKTEEEVKKRLNTIDKALALLELKKKDI